MSGNAGEAKTGPESCDPINRTTKDASISPTIHSGAMQAHAVRIIPGEDLVSAIHAAASAAMSSTVNCRAAFILTAVGSLKQVTLRMASAERVIFNSTQQGTSTKTKKTEKEESNEVRTWSEKMEIVSLVGTLTEEAKHLHMCLSKADGSTVGGHLVSGTVFTTLELVIGTIEGVAFARAMDVSTGFHELVISSSLPGSNPASSTKNNCLN